ncbi:putative zinc protease [Defluviimonas aquaemixtae]|uniref:Putative zinc protease n=1 Tax=Albidovulum aquaemixtae TaxID=1542388 RepID=A0A2R8BMZ3_9RHOB|nr:pitrilysin family protein [Defluviimonas aquaemixtae]SPH24790.1 putative zinc protease [Defluviimonas aquaemixtae]
MIRTLFAAVLAVLAALPAAAVDIREVTSPGGIRAWLVEEHEIPFTALEIRFEGGTSLDRPGKRGAVLLMTALLEEGAGEMDSQGFAEARDALAAEFEFDAFDDAMTISARMLSENRDEAAALLRQALMEPRFDADAVERVRRQIVSIIQSDDKDPGTIARRAFDEAAFGDHPYGSDRTGTLESVAGLTRDDLVAAKADLMAKDRLFVSAVGDITEEELGRLLDGLLGGLPETSAQMPPKIQPMLTGGVTVIDYASPQSVVVFGHAGIEREDPDFFAAYLLNQILGGSGFAARLMEEVREKRGLTYGISTYLVPMDLAETWQGSFASANEKVTEAIEVVRAEWAKVAEEGVTAAELDAAKTYLTGSYPLRFDGNGPIANMLVGMQSEGLPISYVNDRNGYIEAVTLDDIKRVAARLMKPEALRFVVVGQPVGLDNTN